MSDDRAALKACPKCGATDGWAGPDALVQPVQEVDLLRRVVGSAALAPPLEAKNDDEKPQSQLTRTMLTHEEYAALDMHIQGTVQLLNMHQFTTTDSGDGISKPAGERTFDVPHVVCQVTKETMFAEADRLARLVERNGDGWRVEASYCHNDQSAILLAAGPSLKGRVAETSAGAALAVGTRCASAAPGPTGGTAMTYTYAVLEVSEAAYREIADKLKAAGYDQAFHKDDGRTVIDMHGIALSAEPPVGATPRLLRMVPDRDEWLFTDRYGDVYRLRQTAEPRMPLVIVLDTIGAVCRECGRHVDDGGCQACGRIQQGPV